jgi:hypothetical protein
MGLFGAGRVLRGLDPSDAVSDFRLGRVESSDPYLYVTRTVVAPAALPPPPY